MIGERIQQARNAMGLSTRQLGELAGVSAMAISKYESGQNTPSSNVLLALAKAMEVRTEYFFRTARVELKNVEYRKDDKLPEKVHKKIVADIVDQIERRVALGEILPEAWSNPFDKPKRLPAIDDFDIIENIAELVRKHWDLGSNPIQDLIDTFEEHGIKVFTVDLKGEDRFDGLSATVDNMPIIVVGADWVGDRQRFTLSHELGHLVMHNRMPQNWDEKTVESACHRFAGAFLAPRKEVLKALGNKRKWLEPQELMQLKHEFGLSMAAWTFRARDLSIISKQTMSELWKLFRRRNWKNTEPDPQYPKEEVRRFKQFTYRALAEDMIGESKAAQLLGMSAVALHACRNMECPENVVNK